MDADSSHVHDVVVVKFGGSVMISRELQLAFAEDVADLVAKGRSVVVVHGGGPQVSQHLQRMGVESTFRNGLRVTTADVFDVARMVFTGQVQRELVTLLSSQGLRAVGLCGEDGDLVRAQKYMPLVDGQPMDIGYVGEIVHVDTSLLHALLSADYVPVISSIAAGADGDHGYNVNADTLTAALSIAMNAEEMLMLTDVDGLFADWPECTKLIETLDVPTLQEMLPALSSGMIPKMQACCDATSAGVRGVRVVNGKMSHVVRKVLVCNEKIGTEVVADGQRKDSWSLARSDDAGVRAGTGVDAR